LGNQSRPITPAFPHANDAAGADVDARVPHMVQGVQTVFLGMAADDLAVKILVRVQIVVVVIQAGFLEAGGLLFLQHPQGNAGFQTQGLHGADHFRHLIQVFVLRATPGGPHTEAGRAVGLGHLGCRHHFIHAHQLFPFQARIVAGRLGTVAAVLGTTAGLHRQQGRTLDGVGVEMLPMHLLGPVDQVHERQFIQGQHFLHRPGLGRLGRGGRWGHRGGSDNSIHGRILTKNPTGFHTTQYGR